MKLPLSDMTAVWTPCPEVFDVQAVVAPSVNTRFPVLSNCKTASSVTGLFLFR